MPISALASGTDLRRRERDEALTRQLVANLERQAREILGLAASAEFDDTVLSFANYRAFRAKVSEFEALCNVIEGHLHQLADRPRGVLKELFQTRREMILGPSIKAMTAFYTRLAAEGALPFGLQDMLETELDALQSMREAVDATQGTEATPEDIDIRAAIQSIEGSIHALQSRATQFVDFDMPGMIQAILPPEPEPAAVEEETETDGPAAEADAKRRDTPELRAVRRIRGILTPKRKDQALAQHAEIDLRALDDIEKRLMADPDDAGAAKWLRHVCNSWGSRLRAKENVFARIADEIR